MRGLPQSSFGQFQTNTLTALVDRGGSVKVSFFGGLELSRVGDPEFAAGSRVRVASLLDLAGTKAGVIYGRSASKDYLDLCALLDAGTTLDTILAAGRAVYGPRFDPAFTIRALTYFDDLQGPPLSEERRETLIQAAKAANPRRILQLASTRGLVPESRGT